MSSLIPPTSQGGSSLDEDPSASEPRLGDTNAPLPLGKVDESRAENAIELKEVEGLSQGRIVLRRFFRHRGAMISLATLLSTPDAAHPAKGVLLVFYRGYW